MGLDPPRAVKASCEEGLRKAEVGGVETREQRQQRVQRLGGRRVRVPSRNFY